MPPRPSSSSLGNSGPAKKLKADDPLPDREDKTFNHEKADIVLRAPPHPCASNRAHVLFPLRSLVLRGASSVFDDLLDIPQPKGSPPKPIINLTEDADTVRRFLTFLNPSTSRPNFLSLDGDQVIPLFLMAVKYQVDWLSNETETHLINVVSFSVPTIKVWEFCFDHQLWMALSFVTHGLASSHPPITPASFPSSLRRKMGDLLWDRIVDSYILNKGWPSSSLECQMLLSSLGDCSRARFPTVIA
ncbi:hypothetical protein BDY24DRAFT_415730 [Mrakia frigida]|uniref:uncharacterized protein n=1 Tax=Mrakia frigida TaxID=29902 RepID=UPI003FCC1123